VTDIGAVARSVAGATVGSLSASPIVSVCPCGSVDLSFEGAVLGGIAPVCDSERGAEDVINMSAYDCFVVLSLTVLGLLRAGHP
jgi:hypothetical protein